jgi:sporulation protein YlmC with PRC-barrel domain
MSETLDSGLELLDRQILDADGYQIGKVDDLRFDSDGPAPPRLVALLTGHQAFAGRLGGRLGRCWQAVAAACSGHRGPIEIPLERVREIGPAVRLDLTAEDLPRVLHAERWLARNLIGKLPGADRAGG